MRGKLLHQLQKPHRSSVFPSLLEICVSEDYAYYTLLLSCYCMRFTTTKHIITNALSPPVWKEPTVMNYHRRFYLDSAVMTTYHHRLVTRPGGDARSNIIAGSWYELAVMYSHHRRILFQTDSDANLHLILICPLSSCLSSFTRLPILSPAVPLRSFPELSLPPLPRSPLSTPPCHASPLGARIWGGADPERADPERAVAWIRHPSTSVGGELPQQQQREGDPVRRQRRQSGSSGRAAAFLDSGECLCGAGDRTGPMRAAARWRGPFPCFPFLGFNRCSGSSNPLSPHLSPPPICSGAWGGAERRACSGQRGGAPGGGVRHGVEVCGAAARQPIFFNFVWGQYRRVMSRRWCA